MKVEPIVSSETSAIRTQTPGNYPKRTNYKDEDVYIKDGRVWSDEELICKEKSVK